MTIIVYSKNNCVFCTKAKSLLTNLGLEYQEKSLEKDFGSDPSKLIEDIGKNVRIAAKSGVTKNIKDNSVIAGFPATDIKLWKKKIINERKNGY